MPELVANDWYEVKTVGEGPQIAMMGYFAGIVAVNDEKRAYFQGRGLIYVTMEQILRGAVVVTRFDFDKMQAEGNYAKK